MRNNQQGCSGDFEKWNISEHNVGTEELAHIEIVSAIVTQLTRDLTIDEIKRSGFDTYFVDHGVGIYPASAAGVPFDAKYLGVKGDVIADLTEDLAAEQKARVTYDNILRLIDDPDICDPIRFLRERELVHFQRFGETKRELPSKSPNADSPHPRKAKNIKINNV